MNPTRQQALTYFVSVGWTPAQASGLVANLEAESRLNPRAVGDGGKAYGIAQWHPDRQANFAATIGRDIRGSTFDDQLAFVHAELNTTERRAGEALRATTTPREAGAIVSRRYERPADTEGEATKRGTLAEAIFRDFITNVETQPAAPIEDRGRPYNPEQDAPSQEAPMPGIAETIAAAAPAVGTIFGGPVGGLLGSLAGAIIAGFAPLAQEKISRELARHTNSPETAAAVSTALTTGIVDMAKQLTGKADPVEAVVLAKNDPAMMQKMEAATLVKLGELEPFLNAINGYEQAAFERGESSAKAAASRLETIPELRALAVMLARHSSAMMLVILVALGIALAVQMYFSSTHTPDATLATLFGGALAVAYQNYGQVFNLVFGAPPESEASKAGAAELNARRPRS